MPKTTFTSGRQAARGGVLGLALLTGLISALACSDDRGDSASNPPATARADAEPDARDAGDAAGDALIDAADARVDAPADLGAPAPAVTASTGGGAACDSCERSQCGAGAGDLLRRCLTMAGAAAAGPKKDMARAGLCAAAIACVRRTACAATHAADCYCGAGKTGEACLGGKATGACKGPIEDAAESVDPATVMARLFDPNYPSGNALTLIERCDRERCGDACRLGAVVNAPGTCPPAGAPSPCADLDGNCSPDCDETLVKNAGFVSDGLGWPAEVGVTAGWDLLDGLGRAGSGSLALINTRMADVPGASLAGARQCLGVSAAGTYVLGAQVFLAGGQTPGSAGVGGELYQSADCSGPPIAAASPGLGGKTDVFTNVAATLVAPATAKSLAVRLVVSKPTARPPLRALFDNVLVRRQ